MTSTRQALERPYWHVDLKWIFGIFTTFFLILSLLFFILSQLTSEKTAIPLATYIVASQFSRNGIDDSEEIELTKKKYLKTNEDVFYPLGDKNVSITRVDLETLSPREIRLKIFRQVVEPFYYEGPEGIANRMGTTPEQKEQIKKQAGPLGFINLKTHDKLFQLFLISLLPLVLSLTGFVYFSYRYGRLISPAVVFLLVSTIPAVLFFLISNLKPPLDAQGRSEGLPFLPYEMIREVTKTLSLPYDILFLTGNGLLLTVFAAKLFKHFSQKHTK